MSVTKLEIDDRELRRLFDQGDGIATTAAFLALNEVAKKLKTRAKHGISKSTKVRPGAIGRRIRVRRATRTHPHVTLLVYSRALTANSAGGRQTKKRGFTGSGRSWPHAFTIGQGFFGGKGLVVVRGRERSVDDTTPPSAGGAGVPRTPLQAVRIGIHREAVEVVRKVIDRGANEAWEKEFPRLLELGLSGMI